MFVLPKVGNLFTGADPHVLAVRLDKIQKFRQARHTPRSRQTTMQTHRHHFGIACSAFFHQVFQMILQILAKVTAVSKRVGGREFHVVFRKRVGDNEMRVLAILQRPVGQIIRIRVGIVLEAGFDDQLTGVEVGFSLIKSYRTLAKDPFMDGNGPCNVFSFGFFVDVLIIHPSVAVTGDFPVLLFTECVTHDGVSFQCHAHGKDRDGHFAFGKETVEPPKARTGTVVIESFHVEMTFIVISLGSDDFTQQLFRLVISMQKATLSTFFVINDKVECDLGTLGPLELGRLTPVSNHITAAILGLGIILMVRLEPSFSHGVVCHDRPIECVVVR
mmetsp:Transcript_18300/g.34756  ORF Transcript_18300/g.34756 Transcript_18300/m.34756 type:complete len:331 (-) Transcript_18300:73-1065(-)